MAVVNIAVDKGTAPFVLLGREVGLDWAIDNISIVDLTKAVIVGYEPDEVLGVGIVVVFDVVDVLVVAAV